MGLFDALSAGLSAAAPIGASVAQQQAQATQSNTGFLEKLAQMQQQKAKADLDRQVAEATIGLHGAQTQALTNPPETWGDFETVMKDGVPTIVQRSNRGKTQEIGRAVVKPQTVTPGEAIQRPDGTWYVPVPAKETRSKYGTFVDDTGKQRFVDETFAAQQGWLPVPKAGGAGGATGNAAANRQKDYIALMEQGLPDMERLSNKVDPYLITLAMKGGSLANPLIGSNERQYLGSARDFLAGVLHEESGARLSDAQLKFGVDRYFPTAGDEPEDVQRKLERARAVVEARKRNVNYVPPGAPLSPQAQAEISTNLSTTPTDATYGMPQANGRASGTVPKGLFQPAASQKVDPRFGIFGGR